jgi:hypothetical protein
MSEKKINIDLGLFNFSANKTRKKRSDSNSKGDIKIKPVSQKKKNDSMKKKSILKMIRQHQEDRYKKLFDGSDKPVEKAAISENNNFNKDFKEAQLFLQTLTEKTDNSIKNKTLKQYPNPTPNSILLRPTPTLNNIENIVSNPLPNISGNIMSSSAMPVSLNIKPALQNITPNYGCLKNGALPTYRDYMNKTRKQQPLINISPISTGGNANPVVSESKTESEIIATKVNESIKRLADMKRAEFKLQQIKNDRPKKMKRKKTLRRTYKTGKSKVLPRISVLVSNKTIRNNISTRSQLLKQTPIEEVKRFLVKRGLIKVGSITPNDVLRKMYESAFLLCGEVQNHNPDNLLYNFLNDK